MLKNQFLEIKWAARNKNYYENKGYKYTKIGDIFKISVFDLTPKNKCKIEVICDYCNEPYYPTYDNYLKCKSNLYCDKDCCVKCSPLKQKEVCVNKYGVDSTNKLDSVIEKKREKMVLSTEEVRMLFESKGYIMIGEYYNAHTPIEFLCPNHEGIKIITYSNLKAGKGCSLCSRERYSGENHYNWNGGITELNVYLRDRMKQWSLDSLRNSGYKCDITKTNKNLEVHHLHNFKDIVSETLTNLNIKILPKVIEYTKDELEQIVEECTKLHYKYGFGVVLSVELHREFHNIYGKINNTKEQYFEFKRMKLLITS